MTTPDDDQTVGSALRAMLASGAVPPAPVTAAALRARAERSRVRRLDAKVVVALVAVAAVLVALVVVGPLRSTSGPAPSPATRPTVTSTSTSVTTTTVAPGRTRVTVFDPFTADGVVNPALHVTSTLVAQTCEGGGVAGNSSYRCFSGNGIYDPCFARPYGNAGPLLCTTNPASADVVELTTTGALPAALPGAPDQRPWALQLAGGQVCVLVNAAWGGLGPFGCTSPTTPTGPVADCHAPVEGADGWTADCQDAESQASPFTPVTVDTVWK